jgi:transposase-like protein
VSQITEELCGCEISSSDVSRATALLDEELEKWRQRPLGSVKYLILDARYEKVRESGRVRDCAVLTAIGVDAEGHRSVLGVSVSLSEAEVHWREFFKSLLARGLHGGGGRKGDILLYLEKQNVPFASPLRTSLFGFIRLKRTSFHAVDRV